MQIFFYLFSSLIILSSIGVVTSRNPVYAVLLLIFTFLNSSAIFLQLGAEFIAMTIIVVYVGAVAVLFLFVVMMLNIDFSEVKAQIYSNKLVSILIMLALIVDLVLIVKSSLSGGYLVTNFTTPIPEGVTNTHAIGSVLYTDYIVAFQLGGLVLLLSMVSCIVLTLRKREGAKKQDSNIQIGRSAQQSITIVKVKSKAGVDGISYE